MSQKPSDKKKKAARPKRSDAERREAARWARILRVYGLTKEQYDELDYGYCPICTRNWSATVRPCIDHDHKTGEIRGLLCLYCNRYVVGRHRDPDVMLRVSRYLAADRRNWIVPKKKRKKKNVRSKR